MKVAQKALYNMLRINAERGEEDLEEDLQEWQVEDYRNLPLQELFSRLDALGLHLDEASFAAYGDPCETPEDLADGFASYMELSDQEHDRLYLCLFELWRRLLPQKTCLSIFCDELDYQIALYESEEGVSAEKLEDALANLKEVLDANTDEGGDPVEVFATFIESCAHDLEDFLLDFIEEQLNEGRGEYARELLEDFSSYFSDKKWSMLLQVQSLMGSDPEQANQMLETLLEEEADEDDVELYLDVLDLMKERGDRRLYGAYVERLLPWIQLEQEMQELLQTTMEFYGQLDYDTETEAIQSMLEERGSRDLGAQVSSDDLHFSRLLRVLSARPLPR